MPAVVASFSNDERARPPTQLKLEFATDIFIDQVHKFQNSYFNPIQNGGMVGVGVAKKSPPYPPPVTSTNVRVSPHCLTFNLTLLPHWCKTSMSYLVNQDHPLKKVFVFSNPWKG